MSQEAETADSDGDQQANTDDGREPDERLQEAAAKVAGDAGVADEEDGPEAEAETDAEPESESETEPESIPGTDHPTTEPEGGDDADEDEPLSDETAADAAEDDSEDDPDGGTAVAPEDDEVCKMAFEAAFEKGQSMCGDAAFRRQAARLVGVNAEPSEIDTGTLMSVGPAGAEADGLEAIDRWVFARVVDGGADEALLDEYGGDLTQAVMDARQQAQDKFDEW